MPSDEILLTRDLHPTPCVVVWNGTIDAAWERSRQRQRPEPTIRQVPAAAASRARWVRRLEPTPVPDMLPPPGLQRRVYAYLVKRGDAATRKDIEAVLGVTRGASGHAIEALLAGGWIVRGPDVRYRQGGHAAQSWKVARCK